MTAVAPTTATYVTLSSGESWQLEVSPSVHEARAGVLDRGQPIGADLLPVQRTGAGRPDGVTTLDGSNTLHALA